MIEWVSPQRVVCRSQSTEQQQQKEKKEGTWCAIFFRTAHRPLQNVAEIEAAE